ncbi:hypothetical protein H6P81_014871 [Aristolochia fimbriata]|uniref:Uncharacterized protein n=1 Tax=Aristolochia fimbriata TaxID=158543 RepID=A0AAV7E6T3_ARIFI|nr:hypothetical protein H6P81_014871 [Aristolochia fimbriata]
MEDAGDQITKLIKQGTSEVLPLLKYLASNFMEKTKELLPSAKTGASSLFEKARTEGLPLVKERGILLWEKARTEGLPFVKERGGFYWEKAKSHGLPFLKKASWFVVEKMKEHPWASALAVLILILYIARGSGGGPASKMMKAPGRPYSIARNSFERNPKGYFRGLRGKN